MGKPGAETSGQFHAFEKVIQLTHEPFAAASLFLRVQVIAAL
jgi:hypothetical protein